MIETEINNVLAQIRALSTNIKAPGPLETQTADAPGGPGFGELLRAAVERVNEQQQAADALSAKFQAGDPDTTIAEVVVEMQKASISFQAMTEARNRIVEAYREIMNMSM